MDIRQVTETIAKDRGAELSISETSPWGLDCGPDIERAVEKIYSKSYH